MVDWSLADLFWPNCHIYTYINNDASSNYAAILHRLICVFIFLFDSKLYIRSSHLCKCQTIIASFFCVVIIFHMSLLSFRSVLCQWTNSNGKRQGKIKCEVIFNAINQISIYSGCHSFLISLSGFRAQAKTIQLFCRWSN